MNPVEIAWDVLRCTVLAALTALVAVGTIVTCRNIIVTRRRK